MAVSGYFNRGQGLTPVFKMKSELFLNNKMLKADLLQPLDISLPLAETNSPSAWYVSPVKIEPVRANGFTGSIKEGGTVNFRNISFNPHGNGTHTECVGHITPEVYSINKNLKTFFFEALVISVEPVLLTNDEGVAKAGDCVITKNQIEIAVGNNRPQALVIRTLPNTTEKTHRNYSHTNPAYLHHEAAALMASIGIEHLLLDLPSVDREDDSGHLLAHKAFWEYPGNTQFHKTITEFIFVPDEIKDGVYVLNLMIASFENDASPSKPVIYKTF